MPVFCYVINPKLINQYWPDLIPFIEPSLDYEYGELTLEVIKEKIESNIFLVLVVIDELEDKKTILAVQTVEMFNNERGTLCNLVTTGGSELDLWQDLLAENIEWIARKEKCYAIHTRGRLGWLKRLKRNGYKPLYFIAEKILED